MGLAGAERRDLPFAVACTMTAPNHVGDQIIWFCNVRNGSKVDIETSLRRGLHGRESGGNPSPDKAGCDAMLGRRIVTRSVLGCKDARTSGHAWQLASDVIARAGKRPSAGEAETAA